MKMPDDNSPSAAVAAPPRLPMQAAAGARALLPGLALTGAIAAAAFGLHGIAGIASFSPMILAILLGIIALVGVNNLVTLPAAPKAVIVTLTTFMLSMALAAMGLETDIAKLRLKGLRPALLGLTAFVFISLFSFTLIHLV